MRNIKNKISSFLNRNHVRITLNLLLIFLIIAVTSYIAGICVQFFEKVVAWNTALNIDSYAKMEKMIWGYFFNFIYTYKSNLWIGILANIVVLAIVYFNIYKFKKMMGSSKDTDRNFSYSDSGVYGTSKWCNVAEAAKMDTKPIAIAKNFNEADGVILGRFENKIIYRPKDSRIGKHMAVMGASGSMKSRALARPLIMGAVKDNESIIVTDPKGELYEHTAEYLIENGYTVKMFNLVEPQYSDSWDCLREVNGDEIRAQLFAESVINGTEGTLRGEKDFWAKGEMNLLKALILFVSCDLFKHGYKVSMGSAYEILVKNDLRQLDSLFECLPKSHPALWSYNIFKDGSETVRQGIKLGLSTRLQVFQAQLVKDITSENEIDLSLPGKQKCAYFCIMSDQDSTLNFLSNLFFTFLFVDLVRYADNNFNPVNTDKIKMCDVPVNFILDEFPNIGQIPDFTKKISTIRSRDLKCIIIFQGLSQLQASYPEDAWQTILANCDTTLVLGVNDKLTSEYVSESTGIVTVKVKTQAAAMEHGAKGAFIPSEYRLSTGEGRRELMTAHEVKKISTNLLALIRGLDPLYLKKIDYTEYPDAKKLRYTAIANHMPEWRAVRFTEKEPAPELIIEYIPDDDLKVEFVNEDDAKSNLVPEPCSDDLIIELTGDLDGSDDNDGIDPFKNIRQSKEIRDSVSRRNKSVLESMQ